MNGITPQPSFSTSTQSTPATMPSTNVHVHFTTPNQSSSFFPTLAKLAGLTVFLLGSGAAYFYYKNGNTPSLNDRQKPTFPRVTTPPTNTPTNTSQQILGNSSNINSEDNSDSNSNVISTANPMGQNGNHEGLDLKRTDSSTSNDDDHLPAGSDKENDSNSDSFLFIPSSLGVSSSPHFMTPPRPQNGYPTTPQSNHLSTPKTPHTKKNGEIVQLSPSMVKAQQRKLTAEKAKSPEKMESAKKAFNEKLTKINTLFSKSGPFNPLKIQSGKESKEREESTSSSAPALLTHLELERPKFGVERRPSLKHPKFQNQVDRKLDNEYDFKQRKDDPKAQLLDLKALNKKYDIKPYDAEIKYEESLARVAQLFDLKTERKDTIERFTDCSEKIRTQISIYVADLSELMNIAQEDF